MDLIKHMKNEKDNGIIDLEKERRIRDKIQKIKEAYKDNPDGLKRLVEKMERMDDDSDNA